MREAGQKGACIGLSRTDNSCKCDDPAPGTGAAPGSKMTCRSPRNVIVGRSEPAPFGLRCENLPIRRLVPVRGHASTPSGVTLRDLIEREAEGS